jgi:hypothetical protein
MWTNFDGGHSTTSLVSVCPTKACDQCVLLSLFPEYNVSIDDMLSQWNTFPCHRWRYFWTVYESVLTMVFYWMTMLS